MVRRENESKRDRPNKTSQGKPPLALISSSPKGRKRDLVQFFDYVIDQETAPAELKEAAVREKKKLEKLFTFSELGGNKLYSLSTIGLSAKTEPFERPLQNPDLKPSEWLLEAMRRSIV